MKTKLSKKGRELVKLYNQMASDGYKTVDGKIIASEGVFSDFESRILRKDLKVLFEKHNISTVLDYGCGGSDWDIKGFDPESGTSAKEFFGLKNVCRYEPARNLDERKICDAVINFDVLEHIFISDVPNVVRDLFQNARKLLIVNVACYPASATLPDGTNAHITIRDPNWWKGIFDAFSPEFPDVTVILITSIKWRQFNAFNPFSEKQRQQQNGYIAVD